MATYFGADHVVWAYQIGLTTNKTAGERAQKVSLYSWALGSICTIISECWQVGGRPGGAARHMISFLAGS